MYPTFISNTQLSIDTIYTFISCNGASCFKKPVEGSLWVLSEKKMCVLHQLTGWASGETWFPSYVIILNIYLYTLEHV